MDDTLDDDLKKIPYKLEHGLSEEEQIWFSNFFTQITNLQQDQTKILRTINKTVQVIGVIVLLSAILGACGALGI
jgi:hypothetical protein